MSPPQLLPYWLSDDKDYCPNIWKWPPTFEVPDVLKDVAGTTYVMNQEEYERFCVSEKNLFPTPEGSSPISAKSVPFPALLKALGFTVAKSSPDADDASETEDVPADGSGAADASVTEDDPDVPKLDEYEEILRELKAMDPDYADVSRSPSPPPEPAVSRSDRLFGVTYGDLHDAYVHIRGYSDIPETLESTGLATAIHLRVRVQEEDFVEIIEEGRRVNLNNLVYWGLYCNRSIAGLLSAVAPRSYNAGTTKEHLLKYARGEMMKDYGADSSSEVKCQACRSTLKDLEGLVTHLLRKTDEMTYMCKHCGFLKFTNFCAFLYHIFTDATCRPIYRYCIACSTFQDSMEDHLTGKSAYFDAWRVKCKQCSYVAFSTCAFTYHLSLHIKELPYICSDCGEFFLFREGLADHMNKTCYYQFKFRLLMCKVCHVMFTHQKQFLAHVTLKHYERRLNCLLCKEVFYSNREFKYHRTKAHPNSQYTFQIHCHCDLCPNSTFRGMSQEKHLTKHAEEDICSLVLYKCSCNSFFLLKKKFLEHLEENDCVPKTHDRPHILKMCVICDQIKAYNDTEDPFVCEACEMCTVPQIALVSYFCNICHFVLRYDWDAVLDHFADHHPRLDLVSVGDRILIIAGRDVTRGQYLRRHMEMLEYDRFLQLVLSRHIPRENVRRKTAITEDSTQTAAETTQTAETANPVESPVFSTLLADRIRVLNPDIVNTRIDGTRVPAAVETAGEDSLCDDVEQILLYDDPDSLEETDDS